MHTCVHSSIEPSVLESTGNKQPTTNDKTQKWECLQGSVCGHPDGKELVEVEEGDGRVRKTLLSEKVTESETYNLSESRA